MSETNDEWRWERASICNHCEKLLKPEWVCMECGCFMKVKTANPSASCPIGKWHSQ